MASGNSQIDETLILDLHRMLMNSIRPDAGTYRQHSVRIVGADVPTANYVKIPFLMAELIEIINAAVQDTISHLAEVHSRFEQIHPFSDGNGRIGRLLIHTMALRNKLPPAVIRQEKKRFYYSYLNKAQQTQNKDLSLLEDFICDALLEGFQILERK
jgi:Fic family protein